MAGRDFLRAHWPAVTIAVTVAAIAVAAFILLRTMPPRTVVMATGPEGGAYFEVGKQYRAILARAGVELRLVPTGGALDNLAMLRDPRSGVGVALLQGGTTSERDAPELEALGTVFYEPLWLFYRSGLRDMGFDGLRGGKISIGPEGSGTRALSLALLKLGGIDREVGELLALTPQAAGEKLLSGEIDAALMLVSWDSPVVRRLLGDERVGFASFARADAYVALYPFLSKVVVPAGVGNMAKNLPPADATLIAPKASLVVRKDLHPAIQYLLLDAAVQVHAGPRIFQRAGLFPAAEAIDLPLSSEALQFHKSGRPFLQNFLPFWMAVLLGKLLILLIPILGVLYPMMRILPGLYDWMMRSKISRLYGELRFLEDEMEMRGTAADDMVARLDRLERQANHLRVPLTYASMLYMLRNHIGLVRERLKGR